MIQNPDVIERLGSMIGKELTGESLHEVLFCEAKHQKVLRRFQLGKHTYAHLSIKYIDGQSFADILISGNPNTFRVGIEEKEGKIIMISNPRISYTYI